MSKEYHIAFTGHRPGKLGGYNIDTPAYSQLQGDLEQFIEMQLNDHPSVVCHSGLALGGDTVWSRAVFAVKTRYPDRVLFHAEIPMMTQASQWFKDSDINFWHYQVNHADRQTVYGDLSDHPVSDRRRLAGKYLNERNNGMVDTADVLLAVYDGTKSGTGNAVNYARKIGVDVRIVHPERYFK